MLPILSPEQIKQPVRGRKIAPQEHEQHLLGAADQTVEQYLSQKFGNLPNPLYPNKDATESVNNKIFQRNNIFDSYCCVICAHFALIYCLHKTLFGFELEDKSWRKTAVDSGVVPNEGTSDSAVETAITEKDLSPDSVWPSMTDTMTPQEFYKKYPDSVQAAADFNNAYSIQFFQVPTRDGIRATKQDECSIMLFSPFVVTIDGRYSFDAKGHLISDSQVGRIRSTDSDTHDILIVSTPQASPGQDYYLAVDSENQGGLIKISEDYDLHYPVFGFLQKKNMKYKIKNHSAIFQLDPVSMQLVPYGSGYVYKILNETMNYQGVTEVPTLADLPYPLADRIIIDSPWDKTSFINSLA